jgi:agmatine deiminase
MSEIRFPAEWEQQEGTLLCFPHNGRDWPGKYEAIKWAFVEFIKKVAVRQKVFLVVKDEPFGERVKEWLVRAEVAIHNVHFIPQRTNRSWMRDSGPIIIMKNGRREALDFNFNGWAKYANYHLDKHLPERISTELKIPLTSVSYEGRKVVLEGGAIDSNGRGTFLTSEECLLHPSIQVRNKGFGRETYEKIMEEFLGISQLIWLGDGIEGDDTHGHIDDLCRFINENTVVTMVETDRSHKNHKPLHDNLNRLKKARLENGKPLNIIEIPMPDTIVFERLRIPASYANFLFINGAVLVPVFNDRHDRIALNILSEALPQHEIIPISAIDLIWGFGTLHCLSQQIPALSSPLGG